MKFRIAIIALLAGVCYGQKAPAPDSPKPPAEVDQALRARVNEFYGHLLKKEFRKAEGLIADDTKDYYYGIAKPDFTTFELLDIRYSDNFTRAVALTQCTQKVQQPGFPMGEWNLKVPSLWKLENGQWVWYVNQQEVATPVGIVKKVEPGKEAPANAAPTTSGIPKEIPMTPEFAMGKVGVDRNVVTLQGDKAEKVTIANGSAGEIRLVMPKQLGLDLQLERAELKAGDKVALTIRAIKGSYSGIIGLQVIPTREVVQIQVTVK